MNTEVIELKFRATVSITLVAALMMACSSISSGAKLYEFRLIGGHFYGPGPVEPDTALPDGVLRNIRFNLKTFKGYAEFDNDGSANSVLSDGVTKVNQNIDAGRLRIGEDNSVLLAAVEGGPNRGRERYVLADDYSFQWSVDLALDPGFAEGIVRVDNFILTTAVIQVEQSIQAELGMPGGYEQAGSLRSGQYLAGRLGDFDQNGYLDGIVVAAPRVPIDSGMLPGSPVGNQRGFETNVPVEPNIACELTLRGIRHFEGPVNQLLEDGDRDELVVMLNDIAARINVAQGNLERALVGGIWSPVDLKQKGFLVSDRLESLQTLSFIGLSLVEGYPHYAGQFSFPVEDTISKLFLQLERVIDGVSVLNQKTGVKLPSPKARSALSEKRHV